MMALSDKENLRPNEVAAYWNVSTRFVQKLLSEGRLKGFKIGSTWRIRRSSVLEFEAESAIRPE